MFFIHIPILVMNVVNLVYFSVYLPVTEPFDKMVAYRNIDYTFKDERVKI